MSGRNGLMEMATLIRRTCLQLSMSLNEEEWCGMKLERWWAEPWRPFGKILYLSLSGSR